MPGSHRATAERVVPSLRATLLKAEAEHPEAGDAIGDLVREFADMLCCRRGEGSACSRCGCLSAEQAALPLSIPVGVVVDDSATRQELAVERSAQSGEPAGGHHPAAGPTRTSP